MSNHDAYKSLYIHVPFCKQKCAYCDFYSRKVALDDQKIEWYLNDTIEELKDWYKRGELAQIETIYIGGGTPSYLGVANLDKLLGCIKDWVCLKNVSEYTVEANPESFSEEVADTLKKHGVTRISLGVQSFDDDMLLKLGRIHNARCAKNAIEIAKNNFDNVSIDLMCGLPGQTLSMFKNDLDEAVLQDVSHISIYPLVIEDHTVFKNMVLAGQIEDVDEDLQADMMMLAKDILSASGFVRYEVANYAKPGFEAIHNSNYWKGVPYLGVGDGAVTMTQNKDRRMRMQFGQVTDDLDRRQMLCENLMLMFRMSEGVSFCVIDEYSKELHDLRNVINSLVDNGFIVKNDTSYVPTEKGWLLGNQLYGALIDIH